MIEFILAEKCKEIVMNVSLKCFLIIKVYPYLNKYMVLALQLLEAANNSGKLSLISTNNSGAPLRSEHPVWGFMQLHGLQRCKQPTHGVRPRFGHTFPICKQPGPNSRRSCMRLTSQVPCFQAHDEPFTHDGNKTQRC